MYIKMNGKASGIPVKADENGTNTMTLRNGKFYEIGTDITKAQADQVVAAGKAIFTASNSPKAPEVNGDERAKLMVAYDQQMAEEAAIFERKQMKKQGIQPAETAALTGKGVRA